MDDRGRLVGIVTRGDLLKVHLRPDDDIRADVISGVFGSFLVGASTSVHVDVDEGVVTLAGRFDRWSTADLAVRLTRQVAGVVRVVDKLAFDLDDREPLPTTLAFGAV